MASRHRGSRDFAVCIHNPESQVDLTVGKIYQVVKPARNDRSSDIRILDDSGEDYLYPSGWFVPVALPLKVRKALAPFLQG